MRFVKLALAAAAIGGALFVFACAVAAAPPGRTPGVSQDVILIGQSAPRTGPSRQLGDEAELGIRLLFDRVNALGGINGRRLQLVTRDDAYQPDRARDNTLALITQDEVFALVGYVGTDTSAAAMPVFSYHEVPFVGAATGAEILRVPHNKFVFNTRASFAEEATRIVEHLTSIEMRQIAVFYQSDAHGLNGFEAVSEALSQKGRRVVAKGSVERNSTDVSSAVYLIGQAKPDAVILFCAYPQAAAFIREMRKAGSVTQFYSTSLVGSSALLQALGKASHGVVLSQVTPNPWSDQFPLVREYKRLLGVAGREPSYGSLEGFLAARVLAEGIARAGPKLTREGLIAALEGMRAVDLGGFNVGFSPTNHNGTSFVDLNIVARDGRLRQ